MPVDRGLPRAEVKARVLQCLRSSDNGATKAELVAAIGETTAVTVQRVLKSELEADGVVERDPSTNRWRLVDPHYRVSLEAPEREDLQAVLIAEAMLDPIADDTLRARLRSLAEQLDERLRERGSTAVARSPMTVTLTSGTAHDPNVVHRLLAGIRRETMLVEYTSPWSGETKRRIIEPWQLRVHDGALYLRAFDRDSRCPRTFRVAQIERASSLPAAGPPSVPVPGRRMLWGDADPAAGIDEDRPGVAEIELEPPVSRWVGKIVWHPDQEDRWLEGERLVRRVRYRSCREMARKVLAVIEGAVRVEPEELREEVNRAVAAYTDRVGRHDPHKITQAG